MRLVKRTHVISDNRVEHVDNEKSDGSDKEIDNTKTNICISWFIQHERAQVHDWNNGPPETCYRTEHRHHYMSLPRHTNITKN